MYSFSLASSSTDAYGKAALNMPVALMYPSLDRLCLRVSADFFHPLSRSFPYHQEVCLGVFSVRSLDEDSARAQIAGERHAQVRVIEDTKIVRLRRVGSADLTRLHLQLGLSEAAALDKNLIYNARTVSERFGAMMSASKDRTYDWARAPQPASSSCPQEGRDRLPL